MIIFQIPTYIARRPTDILRALSKTVGSDLTAAHFKYQDDPYLIPTSNSNKRVFALAQESGRRAAKWVKHEHADLFQHTNADPPIRAYMADTIYTEQTDVSEALLQNLVKQFEVTDSITVFLLLEKNGVNVSTATRQQLLELICFCNAENPTSEEWLEERWYRQSMTGRERHRKTWKDHDFAEKLFQSMPEPKSANAYDTIIRGMCKYFQAEKAWHLFESALKDNVALNVETYNAIILTTNFLSERDVKWNKLISILQLMNDNKVTPNLITLNNSLAAVSSISAHNRPVRDWALSLLAELRRFDHIKPSLATWYFLLAIYCRENGPTSHILVNILDEVQGQQFTIQDRRDVLFFVTAMDVSCNHLQDKEVANRVNDLLRTGENYNLIGDSFKESIYYRHYFNLLCQTESLDKFMESYNRLVPNIYIPEPSIMENILRKIGMESAFTMVPLIWSQMIIFDHASKENLLSILLNVMVTGKNEVTAELVTKFGQISWEMWQKIEDANETQNMSAPSIALTGALLGNILKLQVSAGNYKEATTIFHKLDRDQHNILGVTDRAAMEDFISLAVQNKEPSLAIRALQYCVENGHENCSGLSKLITETLKLNSTDQMKVQSLVKI